MNPSLSIYDNLGGEKMVRELVESFYPRVQKHPLIGPLFPQDISDVMDKQYMFLSQFFGGPSLYSNAVGHPMMRARHLPFPITEQHAKAWLHCMEEALHDIGVEEQLRVFVLNRLSGPAYHFINSDS
ncbi:globin domain-containing protein [Paenibacillus sp. IHBB 10380]|uniref:globin domain-containing protein n=1 Tax=Paenibacillus sp. IHBB 10380 TaxID=1566358 RepID=UPI0005CFD1E6|nr:globin [Paenibacillus sp. IHBB 10380]AJS60086.1 globin [Paenibacillus sp. IHBB 10380]